MAGPNVATIFARLIYLPYWSLALVKLSRR
jgi:hypothetical protein